MKSCLIITMLLGVGYSQCDANGDAYLNIQDIVIEVDCWNTLEGPILVQLKIG